MGDFWLQWCGEALQAALPPEAEYPAIPEPAQAVMGMLAAAAELSFSATFELLSRQEETRDLFSGPEQARARRASVVPAAQCVIAFVPSLSAVGPCFGCGGLDVGSGPVGWRKGAAPGALCPRCLAESNPDLGALLGVVGYASSVARLPQDRAAWSERGIMLLTVSERYARASVRAWPMRSQWGELFLATVDELKDTPLGHQLAAAYGHLPPTAFVTKPPVEGEASWDSASDSKQHLRAIERLLVLLQDLQPNGVEAATRRRRIIEKLVEIRQTLESARVMAAEGLRAGRLLLKDLNVDPPNLPRRFAAGPGPYTIAFCDYGPGRCITCAAKVPPGPTGWCSAPAGPLCDECLAGRCEPLHTVINLGHLMRELGAMGERDERDRGRLLYCLCQVYEAEKLGQGRSVATLPLPELGELLDRLAQRGELATRSGPGASLVN